MFRFVQATAQCAHMSTHIRAIIVAAYRAAWADVCLMVMAVPEVLAVDTQLHGRGL